MAELVDAKGPKIPRWQRRARFESRRPHHDRFRPPDDGMSRHGERSERAERGRGAAASRPLLLATGLAGWPGGASSSPAGRARRRATIFIAASSSARRRKGANAPRGRTPRPDGEGEDRRRGALASGARLPDRLSHRAAQRDADRREGSSMYNWQSCDLAPETPASPQPSPPPRAAPALTAAQACASDRSICRANSPRAAEQTEWPGRGRTPAAPPR